jgi:hypothetical protein
MLSELTSAEVTAGVSEEAAREVVEGAEGAGEGAVVCVQATKNGSTARIPKEERR